MTQSMPAGPMPFKGPFVIAESEFGTWHVFDAAGECISASFMKKKTAQWLCDMLNVATTKRDQMPWMREAAEKIRDQLGICDEEATADECADEIAAIIAATAPRDTDGLEEKIARTLGALDHGHPDGIWPQDTWDAQTADVRMKYWKRATAIAALIAATQDAGGREAVSCRHCRGRGVIEGGNIYNAAGGVEDSIETEDCNDCGGTGKLYRHQAHPAQSVAGETLSENKIIELAKLNLGTTALALLVGKKRDGSDSVSIPLANFVHDVWQAAQQSGRRWLTNDEAAFVLAIDAGLSGSPHTPNGAALVYLLAIIRRLSGEGADHG